MPWTLEQYPDGARLALTDDVDVFDARGLHGALLPVAGLTSPVRVDLAACRDLDSSILQLLLALRRVREAAGRPLVVEGAAGRVERLVRWFVSPGADHNRLQQGGPHGGRA